MEQRQTLTNINTVTATRIDRCEWMRDSFFIFLSDISKKKTLFDEACQHCRAKIWYVSTEQPEQAIQAIGEIFQEEQHSKTAYLGVIVEDITEKNIMLATYILFYCRCPFTNMLIENTELLTHKQHSVLVRKNIIPVFYSRDLLKNIMNITTIQSSGLTQCDEESAIPKALSLPQNFTHSNAFWSLEHRDSKNKSDPEVKQEQVDNVSDIIHDMNYIWKAQVSAYSSIITQFESPFSFSFYINSEEDGKSAYIQVSASGSSNSLLELKDEVFFIHLDKDHPHSRERLKFDKTPNYKITLIYIDKTLFILHSHKEDYKEIISLHIHEMETFKEEEYLLVGLTVPSSMTEIYNAKVYVIPKFTPMNTPLFSFDVNTENPFDQINRGISETKIGSITSSQTDAFSCSVCAIQDYDWQLLFKITTQMAFTLMFKYKTTVLSMETERDVIKIRKKNGSRDLSTVGLEHLEVIVVNNSTVLELYINGIFITYIKIPLKHPSYNIMDLVLTTTYSKSKNETPEYVVWDVCYTKTSPIQGFGICYYKIPTLVLWNSKTGAFLEHNSDSKCKTYRFSNLQINTR